MAKWNTLALGAILSIVGAGGVAEARPAHRHPATHAASHRHRAAEAHHPARQHAAGRVQRGMASVYSGRLSGRLMADGTPFNPQSNNAASRTLPLGSKVHVTNLRNGRSAIVQVRDRGPHAAGRIMDLSPGSARSLGMTRTDVAPVAIAQVATGRDNRAR